MQNCSTCSFHEILFLTEGEDLVFDGCMCLNDNARAEGLHSDCCEEYDGEDTCPYYEE